MNPPDSKTELLELCDRLLDGEFSAEDQAARLESLVLGNTELAPASMSRSSTSAHTAPKRQPPGPRLAGRSAACHAGGSAGGAQDRAGALSALAAATGRRRGDLLRRVVVCVPSERRKPSPGSSRRNGARWRRTRRCRPRPARCCMPDGCLIGRHGVARIIFASGAEVSLEGPRSSNSPARMPASCTQER